MACAKTLKCTRRHKVIEPANASMRRARVVVEKCSMMKEKAGRRKGSLSQKMADVSAGSSRACHRVWAAWKCVKGGLTRLLGVRLAPKHTITARPIVISRSPGDICREHARLFADPSFLSSCSSLSLVVGPRSCRLLASSGPASSDLRHCPHRKAAVSVSGCQRPSLSSRGQLRAWMNLVEASATSLTVSSVPRRFGVSGS